MGGDLCALVALRLCVLLLHPFDLAKQLPLSEWDKENDKRVSHLYLAPATGGPSLKVTNGEKGETAPQWSPNGKWISLLADRDKGNQIWLISPTGGEADKLTKEDEAADAYRWSPDSKRIVFAARDAWKGKAEREKKKKDKFDAIVVDTVLQ